MLGGLWDRLLSLFGWGDPQSAAQSCSSQPGCPSTLTYGTRDEAAIAALDEANPASIRDNIEYGGWIYELPDGRFGYTVPMRGTETSFRINSVQPPSDSKTVGQYHTHGDYSWLDPQGRPVRTSDPTKDVFGSDNFSAQDIRLYGHLEGLYPGIRGYLGTPSGTYLHYDASSKTHGTLNPPPPTPANVQQATTPPGGSTQ
jgi:hypothetical protein